MRTLGLLFFLIITGSLTAQTTFQTHFYSCGVAATAVGETEDGYFILGTPGGLGCLSFTLLDSVGNIKQTKELRLDNLGMRAWDQPLIQDENGDFFIFCEIIDTDMPRTLIDPFLIKLSGTSLDTIWTKRYRTNENERSKAIQKYKDGYLLLSETFYLTDINSTFYRDSSRLLFIQTDVEGEVLKQVIVRDTFKHCLATGMGVVKNDEIAVSYDAGSSSFGAEGYIGLLDTAFNFKWKKKIDEEGQRNDIPKILISEAKDIIYVNSKESKFIQGVGQQASGNVDAYDLSGRLRWETELYRGARFEIEHGDIAANGDLINCGYTTESNSSPFTKDRGRIFRLSSDGEILWDRLYDIPNTPTGDGVFYSVIETKDGGILAVGRMRESVFTDDKLYVLKLDANGCLTPACDSIYVPLLYPHPSSTRDEKLSQNLKVFPNPSNGLINFSLKENQGFLKNDRLIINDIAGKKIKEIFIQQQTNELFWNAENQPPGIYFYRFFSEEGVLKDSGKIVIQK